MELKDFIALTLADLPVKTKISFDVAVTIKKGKLVVLTGYGSGGNKIKFNVTKLE